MTCANLPSATATGRRRGPSLTRRPGQCGSVYQRGFPKTWNPQVNAFGRFYVDSGSTRTRRVVCLGRCPTRSAARRKLRDLIEAEGINSVESFTANTSSATFRTQAERWIEGLSTRRRKPVKPAAVFFWRHALDKWVLPCLGHMPLAEVGNGALKLLVDTMSAAGLADKTIVSYSGAVKLVVASAVDSEGNQVYPRKWNHDFVGMPIVDKTKQPRPTVTRDEVETIIGNAPPRYALFFGLLAATGLRIGEGLALRWTDFSPDCRVLKVARSIWRGQFQTPKTPSAVRVVDIPVELASILRNVADKPDLLLATRTGRPFNQRNLLGILHATGVRKGFHAFRRFRTETLRQARAPEDLTALWLGHAPRSVTDLYALGLQSNEAWRREWCDRAGLGFSLSGLRRLQNPVEIAEEEVA